MFSNFFKVAIRVFIRYSSYSLTNIFGLAIGIAASIIIFLYVNSETSYDKFHKNADRIYRVGVKGLIAENTVNHAVTPPPLAKTLLSEIDEIENAVRLFRFGSWLVRYGDVQYNEDNIIFADTSFFNVFSFPLVRGNPEEALRKPGSIVISQHTARRYFDDQDPLGKKLRIENDSTYYEITGVMKDVPANSHMHFDMVASLLTFPEVKYEDTWVANYMYTYFLTKKDVEEEYITGKVNQLAQKHVLRDYLKLLKADEHDIPVDNFSLEFILQPIRDIHLRSTFEVEFESNGSIFNIYLFSSLAVVILIISCVNFVSLSTARVSNRAKEVSIRKIAGSDKKVLIRQFLTESSILAIIAMVLALLITELTLPVFNQYIGLDLSLSQLINTSGVLLLILLIVVIGILSGLYPALYLSSFDPVMVMRPWFHMRQGRSFYRRMLVFFQFFIAIGLIAMTIIIFKQYHYMVNKDLGINKENLLIIRRSDGLGDQLAHYKENVLNHDGVVAITNSTYIPGVDVLPRVPFFIEGMDAIENYSLDYVYVSETFAETYKLQLAEGRFFNTDSKDDSATCVLNEAAVQFIGLANPIGLKLASLSEGKGGHVYEIIGVVKNVHFETLEHPVRPMIMILMPGNYEGYLTVRLQPDNRDHTVSYLQNEWQKLTTAYPFVSYDLDASLTDNYSAMKEGGRIFLIISIVAIFISCLGLFSLISYESCRRKYEIGVSKVFGADVPHILLKYFIEVLGLVTVASVFAWTGVFFLARLWFQDIYYHININPLYFLISSLLVLIIAVFSSGYQAYVTSAAHPGHVLKYE